MTARGLGAVATPLALSQALWVYARIGLMSFGGPAGQIALMQEEIVQRRGWVAPAAFDRGLSFAMMLPGPEAQQLVTWIGWRLHGVAGGLAAGLAFILPGMALMIAIAWAAARHGEVPWIAAIFAGVQPVVIALVIGAMRKIAGRALGGPALRALALGSFGAIFFLGAPFPLIVALAALAGLMLGETRDVSVAGTSTASDGIARHAIRLTLVFGALIAVVLTLSLAIWGREPFLDLAVLFLSAAVVTFGGAYAVLPYVADLAVGTYGWLTPAQMLNGLAIAEATPGPLILVNTYAGFFAGWSVGGGTAVAVLTAVLATFYTFAPSFLLILAFAPVVEKVQRFATARRALAGISAAVVGVIANLAVYLAQAAFFSDGLAAPGWSQLALFAIALVLVLALRLPVLWLILGGAAAGLCLHLAGVR